MAIPEVSSNSRKLQPLNIQHNKFPLYKKQSLKKKKSLHPLEPLPITVE